MFVKAGRNDFGLNPVEKQVIALTVAGYSSEEIAKRIGISEPAMRRHFTNICEKLQVSDQLELVLFAIYHQLIDTNDERNRAVLTVWTGLILVGILPSGHSGGVHLEVRWMLRIPQ